MDKRNLTWQESLNMCKQGVCKHFAFDMDGDFCSHPRSFELLPIFGCSTSRMIAEGECGGCSDDPTKNHRELFEPVEKE